jgi:hypothetical protein
MEAIYPWHPRGDQIYTEYATGVSASGEVGVEKWAFVLKTGETGKAQRTCSRREHDSTAA